MGCMERLKRAVGEIIAGLLVILVIIGAGALIFLCYWLIWLADTGQLITVP